jgi:hypothetical protein
MKIIKRPHLLWTSKSGKKTFGVVVRREEPKAEVEDRGYLRQFVVNDVTILKQKALRQWGVENAEEIESEIQRMIDVEKD